MSGKRRVLPPPASGGLRLDMTGFTKPGPEPSPAPDPAAAAAEMAPGRQRPKTAKRRRKPGRAGAGPVRVSVLLPGGMAQQLRAEARRLRRSQVDLILTAYLDHGSQVSADEAYDAKRASVGLKPLRERRTEPVEQLSLSMPSEGRACLDATARKLGMNRSELVRAVLTLAFGDSASVDQDGADGG